MSFYQDEHATIHLGDCLDVMRTMEAESVDACITDPPAGISFMNASWDSNKGSRNQWIAWLTEVMEEALRVMKPGAHGLVWALPRTSHWTGMALEDAGFEVRDRITHHFGSGFPKSASISKKIDKMAGAERKVVSSNPNDRTRRDNAMKDYGLQGGVGKGSITAPATDEAKQWDGWGSGLKPSTEDWWLIRKPLSEKNIAANVLKHGTGGINVDASRVATANAEDDRRLREWPRPNSAGQQHEGLVMNRPSAPTVNVHASGRFPANLMLSHVPPTDSSPGCVRVGTKRVKGIGGGSTGKAPDGYGGWASRLPREGHADPDGTEQVEAFECATDEAGNYICPVALMDEQSGTSKSTAHTRGIQQRHDIGVGPEISRPKPGTASVRGLDDQGGSSRFFKTFEPDTGPGFFYQAKAAASERWVMLNCDCKTVKLEAWESGGQRPNGKTEHTSPQRATLENKSGKMENSGNGSCITSSGKNTTEPSPKVSKSTTSMKTDLITDLITSDLSPLPNTNGSTRDANSETGNGGNPVASAENSSPSIPSTGTYPPKDGPFMGAVVPATYAKSLTTSVCASCGATPKTSGHPTQKPLKLMRYLCKLITPPNGLVLDPFAGSGTTLLAARQQGFRALGIEKDEEYCAIAARRLSDAPLVLEVG